MRKLVLVFILLVSFNARAGGFFSDIGKTLIGAFDQEGLIILGVGAAATALAFTQDIPMHDAWANHQKMSSDVSRVGDIWGQGYGEAAIAVGQLIWDRNNGLAHAEALLVSTEVTYILKFSTQRERPDTDTRNSFPSGHTQLAFTTAASMHYAYGWKVGVPFYALATFTGLSRLADNAHWFSDTVAGATIGVLFARSAAKVNAPVTVTPVTFNDFDHSRTLGLQLTYRF